MKSKSKKPFRCPYTLELDLHAPEGLEPIIDTGKALERSPVEQTDDARTTITRCIPPAPNTNMGEQDLHAVDARAGGSTRASVKELRRLVVKNGRKKSQHRGARPRVFTSLA